MWHGYSIFEDFMVIGPDLNELDLCNYSDHFVPKILYSYLNNNSSDDNSIRDTVPDFVYPFNVDCEF